MENILSTKNENIVYNSDMVINVWKMRTKKNMTLTQLSELSGIPKSTLNDLENEKTKPNIVQLEKIAIALDCRITDLFDSPYK